MDLATELLEKINNSFTLSYQESKDIKKSLEAIEKKTVSYEEAEAFAEAIGKMLVEALNEHITADVLPDEKMYFNIAEKILEPTMENNYSLISEYAKDVQEILNSKANIDVKAVKPKFNNKKLKTLISIISNAEDFEHAKRLWNEPVITNAISIVDDTAKANAQLHFNLGLKPVIVRRASNGCCKWCGSLAGVKQYSPTMGRDIFRRHQNCRCTVIYDPRNNDGKVQDVYTKEWKNERSNQIEQIASKKHLKKLDLQLFAKYKNIPISNRVKSELNTWLRHKEIQPYSYIYKEIGNYRYYFIYYDFDSYAIIKKEKLK